MNDLLPSCRFAFVVALTIQLVLGCDSSSGGNNSATEKDGAAKGRAEIAERRDQALERLSNLGYLQGAESSNQDSGVVVYEESDAYPGMNYCASSHAPEGVLIDMRGAQLHAWSCRFEDAFPDYGDKPRERLSYATWRRSRLLPSGELLAIFEGVGLVKLDRESRVLWSVQDGNHHDFDVAENGDIYSVCREKVNVPRFGKLNPVYVGFVRIYSPDGKLKDSISIDNAFRDSDYPLTMFPGRPKRDIYHTNTLCILKGRLADRNPAFRAGNVLLSFRSQDQLAVLDPAAHKIVWASKGPWKQQHEPVELENGHLLLFDNQGGRPNLGGTRVIEFDPFAMRITWSYEGTADDPIYSERSGVVSRLPSGNTLITVTEQARALEVTSEGRIVWEYVNPHGAKGNADQRAGLFEVVRIDRSFVSDWLSLPEDLASEAHREN